MRRALSSFFLLLTLGVLMLWGQEVHNPGSAGAPVACATCLTATAPTNHGVLLGSGTQAVGVTAAGATNTLLHGNTGANPNYSAVVDADLSGQVGLAHGGTNADLSASGSTTAVLAQDASHVVTARSLVAGDIPNLAASKITTGQIGLAQGGTGVDLSAAGSATAVLAEDGSHVVSARALVGGDLPASAVQNNAANTATAAMTLDMSLSTVANAFKVPVGAGLTSGGDGAIAYDTTNKNTHIRINAADGLAMGTAAALAVGAIPKAVSASINIYQASSMADNGTIVSSTEPWKFGTAGANPHQDLTMGSTTADMTAQSSATCTNITGMTWTINASKNYLLRCNVTRTLAASATIGYCLGGPGTATSFNLIVRGNNGASSAYNQIETGAQTVYGTKTASSGANAATATDEIVAFIQNGSTASGTALTLQTFGNGTNNLTVKANSSCDLKQVN